MMKMDSEIIDVIIIDGRRYYLQIIHWQSLLCSEE